MDHPTERSRSDRARGVAIAGSREPLPSQAYDYIVIGAGIYGLPLAYFLRRLLPGSRVLVLEDNTIPGDCITVNTGGIIRACYSNVDVMTVSAFGRPYFADPSATMEVRTHVHTGFVSAGWVRMVNERETPGIAAELERLAAAARQRNIPGVWTSLLADYCATLSPPRLANLRKVVDLGDVTHVLVDDNGGYADGGTSLVAFLEACLDHGVDVATFCHVDGFLRDGEAVRGVHFQRWRPEADGGGGERRVAVGEGEVSAPTVIVAAGLGSRRLIERTCGLRLATFPTYHQTPMVENAADVNFTPTTYLRSEPDPDSGVLRQRQIVVADLPVISHWRDLYFHSEGSGLTVGAHHRQLHDETYTPLGGKLVLDDTAIEVGLDQILVDKIMANLDYFPVLSTSGLRLGKRPKDIPGGFYIMNPEEIPFEGPVPGTAETLFYIGSGSGTGFKLGPGVSYLLAQRLAGVAREQRIIASSVLSSERARYFYPGETLEADLRALFDPKLGRFRHIGASGVGLRKQPPLG